MPKVRPAAPAAQTARAGRVRRLPVRSQGLELSRIWPGLYIGSRISDDEAASLPSRNVGLLVLASDRDQRPAKAFGGAEVHHLPIEDAYLGLVPGEEPVHDGLLDFSDAERAADRVVQH